MADISKMVSDAISAVAKTLPSQGQSIGVEGVRAVTGGTRMVRGTIKTAVVTSGFSDPVGLCDVSSEVRTRTVIFAKYGEGGWFDQTPPRDGDVFSFPDGSRFSVFSVEEKSMSYFKVGVREC